jgi:hypothetical protein
MNRWRRLVASVGLAAAVAGSVSVASPVDAAPKAKLSVEVADTATLGPGGQTAVLEVTASCAHTAGAHGEWVVLEAFVQISQQQAFGMGGFPLSCTGRAQTFAVTVTSIDQPFQSGQAQASAFVLIIRGSQTQQAQDSEVIQLL